MNMNMRACALDRVAAVYPRALLACFLTCALPFLGCVEAEGPHVGESPTPPPRRGHIEVATAGGFVSVKAHEASIAAILDEIARQCELEVVTFDPLQGRVTLAFERLSLSEALSQILPDESFALEDDLGGRGTVARHSACFRKLWVFSHPAAVEGTIATHSADNVVDSEPIEHTMFMDRLDLALATGDVNARVDALATLAIVRDDAATATAMASTALHDEESSVREEALYALSRIAIELSRPLLAEALGDPDANVRRGAVQALERAGGEESARALARALADPDLAVRTEAVDALAEIGGAAAIELLRQVSVIENSALAQSAAEHLAKLSASGSGG